MYRIEIKSTDGSVSYFGDAQEEGGTWFDSEWSADEIAESMWLSYGVTGRFARVSVVDSLGESLTDWEN